jgi:hypothetical protein
MTGPQRPAPRPAPGKVTPPAQAPAKKTPAAPARRAPAPPPEEIVEEQQEEVVEEEQQEEEQPAGDEGAGDEAALAVVDNGAVAQVGPNIFGGTIGSITGEVGMTDFAVPKLKLAQNVGPLTEELGFTSGDFVLADETILWQLDCPDIEITILRAHKNFIEKTEYGSADMGRIFESIEEAAAAGLTVTWGPNNEPPDIAPQLNLLVLIKQGEGVESELFNLEGPDGFRYALALWRAGGTAYGPVMQKVTSAARTRLVNGLHTGSFLVSAQKIKGRVNSYWQPKMNPGVEHDEAFIEFTASQLGAGVDEQ